MNEQEAIQLLQQRDPAGLEYLVQTCQVKAMRAAYLIVRERLTAEDIVQNAFIRVYERIRQYDPQRPFAPWFMRMVVNDAVKAVSRRIQPLSLDAEPAEMGLPLQELLRDPAPGVESQFEAAEQRQRIWALLAQLSPEQRAVIVLRYYLDFTQTEIADHLQQPNGTIKWRLHAARQRLRALLKRGI